MFTDKLICPICKSELIKKENSLFCQNNHCFDISKNGYVNLLGSSKSGELMGDSKQMALSRRTFLKSGAFKPLCDYIINYSNELKPKTVLDICCGEGYYSSELSSASAAHVYGFDLSKFMIMQAAKRKSEATYFVANLTKIPIKSGSIDFAFHLFAPFYEPEFSRIISSSGRLLSVVPGARHMISLKSILYKNAYLNDEKLPQTGTLKLKSKDKLSYKFTVSGKENVFSMLQMTPYFYRTSPEDISKIKEIDFLEETFEFIIGEYTL